MQSRRDYAASLGLAIAGARGKFSNDAKLAIAKAENDGMVFSDTVKSNKPTGGDTDKSKSAPVYTKADTNKDIPEYRLALDYLYPEQTYKAITDDGKNVGMREACQSCGYSLLDHRCNTPVWQGEPVSIVLK